jgi:hypothetical protein
MGECTRTLAEVGLASSWSPNGEGWAEGVMDVRGQEARDRPSWRQIPKDHSLERPLPERIGVATTNKNKLDKKNTPMNHRCLINYKEPSEREILKYDHVNTTSKLLVYD